MQRDKRIRGILAQYIKSRLKYAACLFGSWIFILLIVPLYHKSIQPVGYAILLCLVITFIIFIFDYLSFKRRHKDLVLMRKLDPIPLEYLKPFGDLLEQDYLWLLSQSVDKELKLKQQLADNQEEMLEYYTLWAHQIKTPISAMRLILQSTAETVNRADLRQELFKIEQYVEMVLSYARMNQMSADLQIQYINLYGMVRQAVKKYSLLFIYNKVELKLEPFQLKVLTDEKWLTFVLEQLLSNAIKYSKKGTIYIYPDPHTANVLVIEDTGIGIRKEDLPRIFERGFTGFNGRMDKRSTGIGLYLCKNILNKLSHRITIDSEQGSGTIVRLHLGVEQVEMM